MKDVLEALKNHDAQNHFEANNFQNSPTKEPEK